MSVFKPSYHKDPVFNFVTKTCIEKPKFTNIKFNKETKDELSSLKETLLKPSFKSSSSFAESFNKMAKSSNLNDINRRNMELRQSMTNESYPRILPQWIKYDKQVLKFNAYFQEHINESNVENYRFRSCYIYFYLDDETIHVVEIKTENSGIPQGTILQRQKIKNVPLQRGTYGITMKPSIRNEDTSDRYLNYTDFQIGLEVNIYGKRFRICDCDDFTRKYYLSKGIDLGQPEKIPEYVNPNTEMVSKIDMTETLKNISDFKEFCEVNLGGGHPNKGLKNFIANDRKVLSFDILWDDVENDKELKQYKMNYYLGDNMVEVREIKESNSGKDYCPNLLKKSFLPKKPHFTYCPGLSKPDEDIYRPKDLVLGNYVNVFNRPCFIYDCDEFTKKWYKENLGIEMKPIRRNIDPPRKVVHNIPPNTGFGSEEDSLLTVFYLRPTLAVKRVNDIFKRDKHILRFRAKLISPVETEHERDFIIAFFVSDNTLQIYEEASKNSGRTSGKFIERTRIKNPSTDYYYSEKDFYVGAIIYTNNHIFKLNEFDEKTKQYMVDNCDVFRDSDIGKIIRRIQKESVSFESYSDFLVSFLSRLDPQNKGCVSEEDILNGLKSFELYLSKQEQVTLFDFLKAIKTEKGYSMEDLFEIIQQL
eukprot:CAMPEP_0170517442 /NCGR_PEP_ID=MMETSP0209-20121228/3435_1 /TAXON_ID=665100 ORGANISM="Litonotus pictus, Strain P1" /NCGR_SAMPLE_ID=MMETSP0209 /ASSEMBLY_ACC=CAM_ASM_000301 /LENGTH=645 /DNA_ID=CAMNT_0010802693 /DNA_START=50 /DNA_END=1987 /DNA_ORIENTATION=+